MDLLRKIAEREGKTPAALKEEPEVSHHALPYLTAFKRLQSSRMIAPDGSPVGISLLEIEAYARMFGFDTLEDRHDLLHYVKICDHAWLEEVKRRQSARTVKHPKGRRR